MMINIQEDQSKFDIEKQNFQFSNELTNTNQLLNVLTETDNAEKNMSVNTNNNLKNGIIINIFMIIYLIVFTFSLTGFVLIMEDLQNFKYCAGDHGNCEYLPTDG